MSVKINSLNQIANRLGLQKDGPAQAFLVETCYKAMDKYVPRRDGNLRRQVELTHNSITYASPYAQYQYYGKKMVMSNGKSAYYSPDYGFWSKKGESKTLTDEDLVYHTAGTGPYWDKRMLSVDKEKVVKTVQSKFGRH